MTLAAGTKLGRHEICFNQPRDVVVGIFPERKDVLIGLARGGRIQAADKFGRGLWQFCGRNK